MYASGMAKVCCKCNYWTAIQIAKWFSSWLNTACLPSRSPLENIVSIWFVGIQYPAIYGYLYHVKWNPLFMALGHFKITIFSFEESVCMDKRFLFSNYRFGFLTGGICITDYSNFQSCLVTKVVICYTQSSPYSLPFGLGPWRIAFKTLTLIFTCSGTSGLRLFINKMGIIIIFPSKVFGEG